MRINELCAFIAERHKIYILKKAGLPKPWTKDSILQKYRFCNVYRALDTQTIWLYENWGKKGKNADLDYWFAALVFRLVNWHETAEDLGYPVGWVEEDFISVLQERQSKGLKVYTGAYMVSTHGVRQDKATYLASSLTNIWNERETLRPRKGEDLYDFYVRLKECFDIGSFLAAQVVADIKFVGNMRTAPDWWTFVADGPGSRRGLNRVMGREVRAPWKGQTWYEEFFEVYNAVQKRIGKELPRISAQDLQNCLCEFDKYERVRLGEGRPRSTYKGV